MLTHRIPSAFPRRRPQLPLTTIRSVPSYRVTQVGTNGVHCRELTGAGSVALKVVRVMDTAFSGFTMDHFLCVSFFPHPPLVCRGHMSYRKDRMPYSIELCPCGDVAVYILYNTFLPSAKLTIIQVGDSHLMLCLQYPTRIV